MVDFDEKGMFADYDSVTHKVTHYQVVFLDPNVMTFARLPAFQVKKFLPGELIDEDLPVSTSSLAFKLL